MPKPKLRSIAINAALLLVTCAITVVIAEQILRARYAEQPWKIAPSLWTVQKELVLHPDLGYTWRPNVSPDENIMFDLADSVFEPLSTDQYGVLNHPAAIADRKAGKPVDILGIGDSFVEHAAHTFYEHFKSKGLTYYGQAVHRHSPPQYNFILEEQALDLDPKWIVYGLFENDFEEAEDYEKWRQTGLDWFAFHSGLWCGRPLATSPAGRFRDAYLPGSKGLYYAIYRRLRGERMSVTGPSEERTGRIIRLVREAHAKTISADSNFLLVLIPSKPTTIMGRSSESDAYDQIVRELGGRDMQILDLRPIFWKHTDRESLFYEIDGHWNANGMEYAADHIHRFIVRHAPRSNV